jgi:hypothetical protein
MNLLRLGTPVGVLLTALAPWKSLAEAAASVRFHYGNSLTRQHREALYEQEAESAELKRTVNALKPERQIYV